MAELGNAAASLVVGVRSNEALDELRLLSKQFGEFKNALVQFNQTQASNPFKNMPTEAAQSLKTAAAEFSGSSSKILEDAASKAGESAGKKLSGSFAISLADGTRASFRQTGTDVVALVKEVGVQGKKLTDTLNDAGIQTVAQAKITAKQKLDAAKAEALEEQKLIKQTQDLDILAFKARTDAAKAAATERQKLAAAQAQAEKVTAQNAAAIVKQNTVAGYQPANAAEFTQLLNKTPQRVDDPLSKAEQLAYLSSAQGIKAHAEALAEDAKAAEGAAGGAHKAFLEFGLMGEQAHLTNNAVREMIVLFHEYLSGRTNNLPGSFLTLVGSIGLSAQAMLSLIGVLALGAGAILTLVVAAAKGKTQMDEMNRAIAASGDFAGVTRNGINELSKSIEANSELTLGQSKDVVTSLVASGQIGQKALEGIALRVAEYAKVTGSDVPTATAALIKLFADPAKGADELRDKFNQLAPDQAEYIKSMAARGDITGAQIELDKALGDVMDKTHQTLSPLQHSLETVTKSWSAFWQAAINKVGGEETPEDRIARLKKAVDGSFGTTSFQLADQSKNKAALAQAESDKQKADADAASAQANAAANKLQSQVLDLAISQSNASKVKQATDNLSLLNKSTSVGFAGNVSEARDAEQKTLDTLQGTKARREENLALTQAQYAIDLKALDLASSLGQKSQQQVISERERIELAQLNAQISAKQATPSGGGAQNEAEKAAAISELVKQRDAITQGAANDRAVDSYERQQAINKSLNDLQIIRTSYVEKELDSQYALGELGKRQLINATAALETFKLQSQLDFINKTRPQGTGQYEVNRQEDISKVKADMDTVEQTRRTTLAEYAVTERETALNNQADTLEKQGDKVKAYWLRWHAQNDILISQLRADGNTTAVDTLSEKGAAGARELQVREARDKIQSEITQAQAAVAKAQLASDNGTGPLLTQDRKNEVLQTYLDKLHSEVSALGDVSDVSQEAQKQIQAVIKGVDELAITAKGTDVATGARSAFAAYVKYAGNAADQTKKVFGDAFQGMEDALVTFTKTGKLDFSSLASSIITDLIRIQVQSSIVQPLAGLLGGGSGGGGSIFGAIGSLFSGGFSGGASSVGAIGGATFAAKGLAFGDTSLHPFAKGGAFSNQIFSSPTLFKFANGGKFANGVMGEAGDEAVMPLTRDAQGRLGVRGAGVSSGGTQVTNQVNVTVNGGDNPDKTGDIVSKKVVDAMRNIANQQISNSLRLGGALNKVSG